MITLLYEQHLWYCLTIAFLFGLFIGSFLNVAAIRIPRGESVVHPPSRCMSCGHRLRMLDLIPFFAYFIQRGKCRYCGERFSPVYAIIELLTGWLYVLTVYVVGPHWELIPALLLLSIFITITITDIREMLIPDKIVLFGVISAVLLRIFIHPLPWYEYAIGMVAVSGLLFLIAFIKPDAMGGGDIKLYVFIGLILGWKLTLLSLFAASLFGLIGSMLLMFSGRVKLRKTIPFGPYIALGSFAVYLWGDQLLHWYINLLIS